MPIRREADGIDRRGRGAESEEFLAGLGIPDLDRAIGAGGGETLAIRREIDIRNGSLMAPQNGDSLARDQVPNANRHVVAGGGESGAAGGDGYGVDLLGVAAEGGNRFALLQPGQIAPGEAAQIRLAGWRFLPGKEILRQAAIAGHEGLLRQVHLRAEQQPAGGFRLGLGDARLPFRALALTLGLRCVFVRALFGGYG